MIKKTDFSSILLFIVSTVTFAQVENNELLKIDMFPKAEIGFKQVYIQVPVAENEENYKIELHIGKEAMVDCNQHAIIGEFKEQNLEGWGYTYYRVDSNGAMTSTAMACLDGKLEHKFITLTPHCFAITANCL